MKFSFRSPITLLAVVTLIFQSCKTSTPTSVKENEPDQPTSKRVERNPWDSLDFKIGQMVMIGINDRTVLKPTDPLRDELASGKAGGIILFEKNVAKTDSKKTLTKLISELKSTSPIPLFVSIDEEGGRVHRLKSKYGFFDTPSAAHLGNINNTDTTLHHATKLAALLDELGINLNYAPTVDLATNKDNPVIAKLDRSFSADPEVVSKHAEKVIEGHHKHGVQTVLKHFPGHGSSTTDSHLGITEVTDQWNIIELIPYSNLIKSGKVDGIMTAHIINCHLSPDCLPATLSKVVITDLLRNMLNFNGVVFSDDMQMYAISKNYGLENAVKLAVNAGVDVIMFGNNVNLNDRITASEVHAIIKKLVQSGEIPVERINESYRRILTMKGL